MSIWTSTRTAMAATLMAEGMEAETGVAAMVVEETRFAAISSFD